MTKQGLEAIERAAAHENCACVPEGWKLVPVEPTPEIMAAAAMAAWPLATEADLEMGRKAARIMMMHMDIARGASLEMIAASVATMAPAYRAMLAAAPAAPTAVAVSSSSDAYDKVDRLLRGSLDDEEYAEYSAALDSMLAALTEGAREGDNWRDLALEMTGAAQANLAQSDLWRLRYETLRALYPSAPSEYELDTAINHAAKVQAAKEGKS